MYSRAYSFVLPLILLLIGAVFHGNVIDEQKQGEPESDVGMVQQAFFLKKLKPDLERVGVLWKKGAPNQERKLRSIESAAASIQAKLFVAYVEDKSEVPEKFRLLSREHDVQALWIIENDGVVDASVPKEYLIENTVKEGIPLMAPTTSWVDAGAPFTVQEDGGKVQIMLNEPAAVATGLQVPDEYKSRTRPIVAAE